MGGQSSKPKPTFPEPVIPSPSECERLAQLAHQQEINVCQKRVNREIKDLKARIATCMKNGLDNVVIYHIHRWATNSRDIENFETELCNLIENMEETGYIVHINHLDPQW